MLRGAAPELNAPGLAELLRKVLAAEWNAEFHAEDPTAEELAHARRRASFFTSRAHLERR